MLRFIQESRWTEQKIQSWKWINVINDIIDFLTKTINVIIEIIIISSELIIIKLKHI